MINLTKTVFVRVINPQGCGQSNCEEYVNAYNISRVVPEELPTLGHENPVSSKYYTVHYEAANAAGTRRYCTGTVSESDGKQLLDIIG